MVSELLVISGIPRSRTSLMMCIIAEVFGEDFILGKKFPSEIELKYDKNDKNYGKKVYFSKLASYKYEEKQKHTKMMNPLGFWEFQGTMGFVWDKNTKELIKELYRNSFHACKIVAEGLSRTNPEYIGKIIYMLRHPLEIAQSQENLIRNMKYTDSEGNVIDFERDPETNEKRRINDLSMFFRGVVSASEFFIENENIPVYFCNSDNLVRNPVDETRKIEEFLNPPIEINGKIVESNEFKGFEKGVKLVDTSLYRSRNNEPKTEEEIFAVELYELFKNKKFKEVLIAVAKKNKEVKKEWYCPRFAYFMDNGEPFVTGNADNCNRCYNNINGYRDSMVKDADSRGVDYKNIACPYECLYIDNPVSIEESIKNNFWL